MYCVNNYFVKNTAFQKKWLTVLKRIKLKLNKIIIILIVFASVSKSVHLCPVVSMEIILLYTENFDE